ncbi:MAG: DUF6596 domain-containing protein [Myxococcota bacterium]
MSLKETQARAEEVARAAYGKLVAMLASRDGDLIAAEDALSDAFVAALRSWPERGIPDKPEAWLLTVARNRRTDSLRKDSRLLLTDEVPDMVQEFDIEESDTHDERLKLLFVCAHPAIDRAVRTPLMLQTVLGLDAEQIAQAFLASPTAMAQRLVRAKRKIKSARIPFLVPERSEYEPRLEAVLEAIYGAYCVDWLEHAGELSREALFLSSILCELVPENPEVLALNALIALIDARRAARVHDGVLVPVFEQDTNNWNARLIDHAHQQLRSASQKKKLGRFQLEAAIQAVHAARIRTGRTDWRSLSKLYAGLMQVYPTIGAAVSRAAVVAQDAGPEQGLSLLDAIEFSGLESFQPAHAVRAHCLERMGMRNEALAAYSRAIDLCTDIPSRRWLQRKRDAL